MSVLQRAAWLLALAAGLSGGAPQDRYSVAREPAGGAGSPQVIVLRDNVAGLEAAITPSIGGELSSLRVRFNGAWVELLYRARDYGPGPGFRGKASFLWPAVGGQYAAGTVPASSCGDGDYPVGDRRYPMPCHGFAKDLQWHESSATADDRGARATVELRDSASTRADYPFGFLVRATYAISGGRLSVAYTVAAARGNAGPMPFAIGNHVALRVPFVEGTDPAAMLFETNNSAELLRDSHGLVTPGRRMRSFAKPTRLGDFDATVALPLIGYRGGAYARVGDPQGLALRIVQRGSSALPEPLVRFNVYGGPKQGYFCPEPWFGLQNSLNLDHGKVTLKPGAEWQWTVEITPEIGQGAKVNRSSGK
jgi:galactose mutarotase-like enzyme